MSRRTAAIALAAATALAVVLGLPSFSGASYVWSSTAGANVAAAPDWTPPTVSIAAPGASVSGITSLTVTAADLETGVASVSLQHSTPGGDWVTICTDTVAPYTCEWDTRVLPDGAVSLRATALDGAGYSASSPVISTTVANKVHVLLDTVDDAIRGTVPLTATVHDPGTTAWAVRFEYSVAGAGSWRTIGTDTSAPYTVSWTTSSGAARVANGEYDLRAVASAGAVTHISDVASEIVVDNQPPSAAISVPAGPLRGTVTLAAIADDAHSGVDSVTIEYAAVGGQWLEICSLTEEPYTCTFDTTELADGGVSFRAVITDGAGNSATSSVVSRSVDNTVSTVSVTDPGAVLNGNVTVAARANSTAGITSVRIQRAPTGSSTWTDLCSDTVAPYVCAWDTTQVSDGLYDLRAILVDGSGRTTTSAVVTGRRVDNAPFRGLDVQTVSAGAPGRLDVGDQLVLIFSKVLAPASVSSGWDGSPTAVTLRLRDGNLLAQGNKGDTLDVQRSGIVAHLGSVNLRGDYIKNKKAVTVNAVMTLTTVTVNGDQVSQVVVTTTSAGPSGLLQTATAPAAMLWTPSAAVREVSGNGLSTAPVTESGPADREF